MKRTELTSIKGLSIKELADKAKQLRKEISDAIIDKNMKKNKDIKIVFKKRKDLAQVLTVIRQKELLEQFSVLSDQLSDKGKPVVSKSVTEKQKTDKPKSENRKPKTDNRKTGGKK